MGKVTSEMSRALATVIRKRREAKGISLTRLAQLAGVTQTYPGMIEKGQRSPTVDVAHSMAKAIGCDLSDLTKEAERVIKRKK